MELRPRHTIPLKFALVLTMASAWTALSVWLSRPWLHDLTDVTNLAFALIAITFIAYVPGFMNAFLFGAAVRSAAGQDPAGRLS